MEKLTIVRTNPAQGKPVKVQFKGLVDSDDKGFPRQELVLFGTGEFPFSLWLQFEKLVKDGLEGRARTETREYRRIEVEFRPTVEPEPPIKEATTITNKSVQSQTPRTLGREGDAK